ncbi:MAG: 3-hydroxyacyl-CoA dehydrogenase NAD-binding domain-containing protein [Pseudomonadota bacterium]
MNYENWKLDIDEHGIAWLCIDKPASSANTLSASVLGELDQALEALENDLPKGLVLYSGKEQGFIMGADINEFTKIASEEEAYTLIRQGQSVMDRVEALRCPTVAVINGFCLGGGLELAMACDYRVAYRGNRKTLGLPEVQLGIHPGFGGTVRAVQLAGVRPAMQIMLTGAPIRPGKAASIGLVDRLTDADGWRSDAKSLLQNPPPKRRQPLVERLLGLGVARPLIKNVLIKQVQRKARKAHYPAPYAMIDLWADHGASPATGYEAEARSMAKLVVSPTSRNLVRVFFLQDGLKSQGDKTTPAPEHVHVVGAGVMGGDIAAWCALRGMTVTLQDRERKYIDPAMARAEKLFEKRVRDTAERRATQSRLTADVAGDGARKADLVIEAIFENLEAKQALYRDLQARMKPGAMLATNTSSIPLEELRTVLDEPQRFIGLHFFNPVAMLPLVEIIRCEDTEQAALNAGFAFTRKISKLPLECRSAPGFVVNRILAPYMAEAMALIEEGVPLRVIDSAAEAFGMPMGPVELVDSVGIDVALGVSKVLAGAMDRPVPQRLSDMVAAGKLGRKSGEGFYRWAEGKAIKPEADGSGPSDIEDRLILPMVNEAVACLADRVVADADKLDAGVIFGTGFAPFRGGPLNYAKQRGLSDVRDTLGRLREAHGERFRPHAGFADL